MTDGSRKFDVVIIGGGPAGAAAAIRSRQLGLSVAILDRDEFPRFHIGESLLPRLTPLLEELGVLDSVRRLPHVPKHGASFAMGGDDATTDFWFAEGPRGEPADAFSIERSVFDQRLLEAARDRGADVRLGTPVREILRLDDGGVELGTPAGTVTGGVLIDASGQSAVIGRWLRTRRPSPGTDRVAYFQRFEGVHRRPGAVGGHPIIVFCDEGWFWMIPLDESATSVGLVMDRSAARRTGVPPTRMLGWGIARSPFVRARMADALGPSDNLVGADFSYTCAPFAGPGHFLAGDAATFIDPIFSTGVCMAMMTGVRAAESAAECVAAPRRSAHVRRDYIRYVRSSSSVLVGLARNSYRHGFRELLLHGSGPLDIHRAVLSVLAGHVFPRPARALRWRVRAFNALLSLHERVPLTPRRAGFSLLDAPEGAAEGRRPDAASLVGAPS